MITKNKSWCGKSDSKTKYLCEFTFATTVRKIFLIIAIGFTFFTKATGGIGNANAQTINIPVVDDTACFESCREVKTERVKSCCVDSGSVSGIYCYASGKNCTHTYATGRTYSCGHDAGDTCYEYAAYTPKCTYSNGRGQSFSHTAESDKTYDSICESKMRECIYSCSSYAKLDISNILKYLPSQKTISQIISELEAVSVKNNTDTMRFKTAVGNAINGMDFTKFYDPNLITR